MSSTPKPFAPFRRGVAHEAGNPSIAVGGSGNVRVRNISGAIVATFTVTATTPTWLQTTANLPADHTL